MRNKANKPTILPSRSEGNDLVGKKYSYSGFFGWRHPQMAYLKQAQPTASAPTTETENHDFQVTALPQLPSYTLWSWISIDE